MTPGAVFNGHAAYFPAIKIEGKWKVYRGVTFGHHQDAMDYAERDIKDNKTERYK